MVNNYKIALMILALVSILAMPVLAFLKFRKSPELFQGVLWSFISYFVFNIVNILLTIIVASLIFPAVEEGAAPAMVETNGALLAAITAIISAIAFLIAGLVMYRFQLKKVDDKRLPVLNSMIFNTLAGMTMVSPLITNILLAVNANMGKLDKYVNAEASLQVVKEAAAQINSLPVFALLDIGVTYWLDLVVYGIGFALLYKYWKNKDTRDVKKYLVLTVLMVFSHVFVGRAAVHYLSETAFVPFVIKIVFVALLYFGYKRFEESQEDHHDIIEVN